MPGPMSVAQGLQAARVIAVALVAGVVLFGAVAVFVVEAQGGAFGSGLPAFLWFAWSAVGAGAVVAWRPVRLAMLREGRRSWDPEDPDAASLAPHFVRLTILHGALAEAPSLFALVLYLISGQRLALIVAAIGALVLSGLLRVAERFERFREQVVLAVSAPT